jgi:hypothetical protein
MVQKIQGNLVQSIAGRAGCVSQHRPFQLSGVSAARLPSLAPSWAQDHCRSLAQWRADSDTHTPTGEARGVRAGVCVNQLYFGSPLCDWRAVTCLCNRPRQLE